MRGDPWIVNLRCQMVTERETDGQTDSQTGKEEERDFVCVCERVSE